MQSKPTNYIIPFLLVIYSLVISLQGIDFGDAGWQLTGYDHILRHPESVHYSFMFWLSNIFGNLWHSILPNYGLYWSRIGVTILLICTFFIYRHLLRNIVRDYNWSLVLGLMYLHIYGGGPEALHYEIFTIFTTSIIVWLLYHGLERKKLIYIFLFGIVLSINLFLKISNIVYLLLIVTIIIYAYLENWKLKQSIFYVLISILGFSLSVILIIGIMKSIGHWQLFLENISFVRNMAQSDEASHGISNLLLSYIIGYSKIAVITILPILFLLAYKYIIKDKYRITDKAINTSLMLVFIIISSYILLVIGNPVWSKILYSFYGFILLLAILQLLSKEISNQRKLILSIGLILMIVAPLGSDSGLEKLKFGVFLLGSISMYYLETGIDISIQKFNFNIRLSSKAYYLIATLLFISFTTYAWNNTYNDPGSRFEKVYTINNKKLTNVYTTKERASVVNELLSEIKKYVKPNDYLLAFNELPMLNYLTDTKPYISTSWIKLIYNEKSLLEQLDTSVKTKGLPVILRQKANMGGTNWPNNIIKDYTKYEDKSIKYRSQGIAFNTFLKKYGYHTAWENNMFEILVTQ